jgi:threonine dehydrogenase-like Zn-dependent dehydrogenase
MQATVMRAAGDVRIEDVPDPSIVDPTDAIIRVTRACICGSDLWPYASMEPSETGQSMGHEAIGIVDDVGAEVRTIKRGDLVVMPFASSDGTCVFCREGLPTACVHVGFFGNNGLNGAQAEALRVPYADGTLFPLPVGEDHALMASLLTLSDVMGTGHHAAVVAKVRPGNSVAVVGDGAVGLCAVIAAKRLGAEQIIIMGRHPDRIVLAKQFGATDVVRERGAEAVERVRPRPHSPRSSATSPSAADPHRSAPTAKNCCPTSSRAASSPERSSTATSDSTASPTATGRWPTASRSRSW